VGRYHLETPFNQDDQPRRCRTEVAVEQMTVECVDTHPNTRDFGSYTAESTCLGHMRMRDVWSESSKDSHQADECSNVSEETRIASETWNRYEFRRNMVLVEVIALIGGTDASHHDVLHST
jgi:hypothetical protein